MPRCHFTESRFSFQIPQAPTFTAVIEVYRINRINHLGWSFYLISSQDPLRGMAIPALPALNLVVCFNEEQRRLVVGDGFP